MTKKLLALLLALCLTAGGFTLCALATEGLAADSDGLVLIFEENFEEYEKDVNVSSTLMPNFFVNDANAIGDGYIQVKEATNGNLYLKSHVFTQIYSATPIVGAYDFSLDIHEAQGSVQTGVFIRAPKTAAAYYEADSHPDTSVSQAGLLLYTRADSLGVNVKTYDENASSTAHLQNNTVKFALPEGASYPYNLRVTDTDDGEIAIYVNGTLVCRVTYADPGQVYGKHESEGKFYGTAKLLDAEGNEMGSYTNPLMSSDASYVGWTTRVADMTVDNVAVKVEPAYVALLAINELPAKVTDKNLENAKELAAEARALYDALPDDKKDLVINFGKLTKAENAIAELEAVTEEITTEAPTEPVEPPTAEETTEEPTQPVETPTDEVTSEEPTNAPDGETTDDATEALTAEDTAEADPEVKVIDDSLAVWILIAVMIVAVCGAAGFITVKVRK